MKLLAEMLPGPLLFVLTSPLNDRLYSPYIEYIFL